MSVTRMAAVARRLLAGFRRDHRSLALVVVVPLVITALLAWVIRGSLPGEVRVAVSNPAGAAGEVLVEALRGATGGDLQLEVATDEAAAREKIREGVVQVALILPADLATEMSGGRIHLRVVTEGTDPAVDGEAIAALQQLVIRAAASLGPGTAPMLEVAHETVFLSPQADTLDVMAPVFLGYFAYFFVFLLTGISFLRERVGGTLERLLATPVSRAEIVIGYGLGFGALATVQVVLLTAFILGRVAIPAMGPLGEWGIGLGVHSAGSPLLALLVVLVLALGAVNLGIFLSTFARTELQLIQFIPIVIVPQGLLSGIFWPVDRLPDLLQGVARLLPVTYAVDALRAIILRGDGLEAAGVTTDLGVLLGMAAVFVLLASRTIKRDAA